MDEITQRRVAVALLMLRRKYLVIAGVPMRATFVVLYLPHD